jgi:small-conductance mechanosensitive channel
MKQRNGLIIWIILVGVFWTANYYFPHRYIESGFYTFVSLAIIHIIFKIILERQLSKKIKEKKMKYNFKKIISIGYIATFIIVLAVIWSEGTQELTVVLGLASAGVAFALQDLLKNLAGGMLIYITRVYSVGDRIEINSKTGDVIDIGILYTTLLETREWITADLPTGRLSTIPNGNILSTTINNYTKDHGFIWDEISFPLDYKSDTDYAYKKFMEIASDETKEISKQASQSIKDLGEKYYLDNNSAEPTINFSLTSNDVSVKIRYPVAVRQRGITKHNISNKILQEIKNSNGKIQVATSLLDIVGFPDVNIKKESKL